MGSRQDRRVIARAAARVGQSDAKGSPVMASEDFGLYADHVPANFTFIGNGLAGQRGGVPLHSHDYDFNDAILPVGIRYYSALAARTTLE
ncbi:M20/M25/M40 family metallo-hydrolase [Microbacterium sp. SSM24]|uniref:M20/M25/M40 family metallo-hydrolase n=1 Tax=Microbacterium sp. SSM24 TaxID=2991714 RepID=UPI0039B40070